MSLILALLALVLGAAGLAHLLAPVGPPPGEEARLRRHRKELAQKAAASELRLAELEDWIEDLRMLQARMRAVAPALYRSRLERLEAGVALLERQVALEEALVRECARADELLEVESETLRVAGRLEDEVLEDIAVRLSELEAVRESNRELEHLLEAAEEVEALLREPDEPDPPTPIR